MEMDSIREQVKDYIARNFLFSDQGFPFAEDASFLEEGIIDSLGITELVAFVEKKFGVSVPDQDLLPDNFDSVNKLTHYLSRRMGQGK